MLFYFNECSIQGQFKGDDQFRSQISALLEARTRSPALARMRTTPALADRHVSHDRTVRQVVQSWRGAPESGTFMAWIGKYGPFIHDDRLPEKEDLFLCFGVEVTDGGLGEAARRLKATQSASALSFAGGDPDFASSPLAVVHGFEDKPIAIYQVTNHWEIQSAVAAGLAATEPADSWRSMIEVARQRFPNLTLPDAIHEEDRLAREPFEGSIRDRIYDLLEILNAYMSDRGIDGIEGPRAREILRQHFQGERAPFSPESDINMREFKREMTFADPDGGPEIFAHWHGKISHRFFRLHFQWPVPSTTTKLKVLYVGPKLTKS